MLNYLYAQILPKVDASIDPIYFFLLGIAIAIFILLKIYNVQKDKRPKKIYIHKEDGHITSIEEKFEKQKVVPDRKELKMIAKMYSFSSDQMVFLERLFIAYSIRNPLYLLEKTAALEEFFAKVMNQLQSNAKSLDAEKNKTLFFTIREAIENRKKYNKKIESTRSLRSGQKFTLITKTGERYPAIIFENNPSGILCRAPRDFFGNELRLPLLARISVYFYDENGQSYRFNTRISKYASGRSETIMVLSHTDSVDTMPNRQHDRKDVHTPCNFSHVSVANIVNGKHTEHKFYTSGKPMHGTMIDISAGGCSFTTKFPPADGEYIELSCILENTIEDKMIGKVVNTDRDKEEPEVHIRFAKMPRATMNRIFAYVYIHGEVGK